MAYKREGYRYFRQMMEETRDRVTDLIFRVRVDGQQAPAARNAYGERQQAVHAEVDDNATAYGDATQPAKPEQPQPEVTSETAAPPAPPAPASSSGTKQPKKEPQQEGQTQVDSCSQPRCFGPEHMMDHAHAR